MDKKEMHNEEIDFNYVGVYQNSITHFHNAGVIREIRKK